MSEKSAAEIGVCVANEMIDNLRHNVGADKARRREAELTRLYAEMEKHPMESAERRAWAEKIVEWIFEPPALNGVCC